MIDDNQAAGQIPLENRLQMATDEGQRRAAPDARRSEQHDAEMVLGWIRANIGDPRASPTG